MNIYRVSTEKGFESEVLDSALFSNKGRALDYAQNLADKRRGTDEYYMCCVSVDKLTPDDWGEFQCARTLICHAL